MSRIIVITSGKGGVGKTTVTANLGAAIANLGRSVALVDADFGLRNLDLLLGLENRVVFTAVDAIAGECRLQQALVKDKRQGGLALLPAAQNRNKEAVTAQQMKELSLELSEKYDYVIVDSPAGIEVGFQNAITAAQEAIIVTTPEVAAVRDADRVVGLLEANGIKRIHLIVNRMKAEMVQLNEMMSVEDILEILAVSLIGIIPDDQRVVVSSNRGEPLILADKVSLPGMAFNNIARRLEGDKVRFLDLMASQDNLINRFRRWFR
ncbi:MAG: septum site-determining protein MinD [Cyanobacteria bacterium QS_4_48_99]|nr:MAG: septum site-determining protein MinD [Cyanobacteria bacterium QS_4_48_99]